MIVRVALALTITSPLGGASAAAPPAALYATSASLLLPGGGRSATATQAEIIVRWRWSTARSRHRLEIRQQRLQDRWRQGRRQEHHQDLGWPEALEHASAAPGGPGNFVTPSPRSSRERRHRSGVPRARGWEVGGADSHLPIHPAGRHGSGGPWRWQGRTEGTLIRRP